MSESSPVHTSLARSRFETLRLLTTLCRDWLSLFLVCCLMSGCFQESSTKSNPAKGDTEALRSLGSPKWFDQQQLSLKPPQVQVDVDHPVRTSGRVSAPKPPPAPRRPWSWGTWSRWSAASTGKLVLIGLGLILIVALIVLALFAIMNWTPERGKARQSTKSITIDPTKISDLPFESSAVSSDPLAQARTLLATGDYDQATLFLYGYMLLALDRAGAIRLHRGKTNRMYLRELREHLPVRTIVELTMLAFEDVFFGRHKIEQTQFMTYWSQLDLFHDYLLKLTSASQASGETSNLAAVSDQNRSPISRGEVPA